MEPLIALGFTFGLAGFIISIATLVRLRVSGVLTGRFARHGGLMPQAQNEDEVLTELKALKQQIGEMQSTNNQFSLGFDESLTRMENRVGRIETKTAASASAAPEETVTLGQSAPS